MSEDAPTPLPLESDAKTMTRLQKAAVWLIGLVVVAVVLLILWPDFDGKGSPSYARKWSARLSQVQSPEEARAKFNGVSSKVFLKGEWVVGVCADSHGSPWGGTLVTRDSRARTRVFFGHVCGSQFLTRMLDYNSTGTLDQFYMFLTTKTTMREWTDPGTK